MLITFPDYILNLLTHGQICPPPLPPGKIMYLWLASSSLKSATSSLVFTNQLSSNAEGFLNRFTSITCSSFARIFIFGFQCT